MKYKTFYLFIVFCFSIAFVMTNTGAPSQNKQAEQAEQSEQVTPNQRHQEFVDVVNVEMILRVQKNGAPVSSLKQTDFMVYENKKLRPITGFEEVRRKAAVEKTTTPTTLQEGKRRLFFLYFRVNEPDPEITNALDYFFKEIYRENDYVLLMSGDRVLAVTRPQQIQPVLNFFNKYTAEVIRLQRMKKQKLSDDLERMCRDFLDEVKKNASGTLIQQNAAQQLLDHFKAVYQLYKRDSVPLSEDKLKAVAASIQKLDLEKWGIVFYQQEDLPSLNLSSLARMDKNALREIRGIKTEMDHFVRQLNVTDQLFKAVKEFQQSFIEANATFHLLLSKPGSMGKMQSTNLTYQPADNNWQQAFKNISSATGGGIVTDNHLEASLKQAVAREDVFYRVTYAPAPRGTNDTTDTTDNTSDQMRKIRIKTNLKGVTLHYHKHITIRTPEKININRFVYNHPRLEFTLENYRRFFDGNGFFGDISVKISGVNENGEITTFNRILEPDEEQAEVSMDLEFPAGGSYSLILEVLDRQTGKSAIYSEKVLVPKNKYELEQVLVSESVETTEGADDNVLLDALLKKAALYCQKLKKAAFYFICTEEIIDNYWKRGILLTDKRYFYDYQIIKEENGKMTESRKLKEPKPQDKTKEQIKNNFFSSYPYLMPITMLAKNHQPKYHYRILGRETNKDRQLVKLSVEPKEKGLLLKGANYGVVWLDEADGSVFKIKLDADSVGGINQLKRMARQKQNRLLVSDIHTYEVQRQGVRFPSRTEIMCSFLEWEGTKRVLNRFNIEAIEKAGTIFQYRNYRFFNVNVDVIDSGHK